MTDNRRLGITVPIVARPSALNDWMPANPAVRVPAGKTGSAGPGSYTIERCPKCGAMAVLFKDYNARIALNAYAELGHRFGERFSMVSTRPNHDWSKGKVIWHIVFHNSKERSHEIIT